MLPRGVVSCASAWRQGAGGEGSHLPSTRGRNCSRRAGAFRARPVPAQPHTATAQEQGLLVVQSGRSPRVQPLTATPRVAATSPRREHSVAYRATPWRAAAGPADAGRVRGQAACDGGRAEQLRRGSGAAVGRHLRHGRGGDGQRGVHAAARHGPARAPRSPSRRAPAVGLPNGSGSRGIQGPPHGSFAWPHAAVFRALTACAAPGGAGPLRPLGGARHLRHVPAGPLRCPRPPAAHRCCRSLVGEKGRSLFALCALLRCRGGAFAARLSVSWSQAGIGGVCFWDSE